jgi:hypothetical protein
MSFLIGENKKMNYKKILIINLSGIGDLLLSIPALKALRYFSNSEVEFAEETIS